MRIFASLISALATVFFVGCASGNDLTLGTIGPQLPQPAGVSTATGSLVVYSAFETGAAFNSRNESGQSYSDYKIFTSEGRLLQQVHNDSGTMEPSPVAVRLTPGKYTVVAQANGYASVTVPVIIASFTLKGVVCGRVNQPSTKQIAYVCQTGWLSVGNQALNFQNTKISP